MRNSERGGNDIKKTANNLDWNKFFKFCWNEGGSVQRVPSAWSNCDNTEFIQTGVLRGENDEIKEAFVEGSYPMSILPQLMPAEEQKSASHHKCPLFWKSLEVTARSRDAHNWTENVLKDRNRFRPLLDVASVCIKRKMFLVAVWPFFFFFTEHWCPIHLFPITAFPTVSWSLSQLS